MITVEEANFFTEEAERLALSADLRDGERIAAAVQALPTSYYVRLASGLVVAMFNGVPIRRTPMPLSLAKRLFGDFIQSELIWNFSLGKWEQR